MRYLLCALIKDEHKHLPEWIEHHKKIGFDILLIEDHYSISHYDLAREYNVSFAHIEELGVKFEVDRKKQAFNWVLQNVDFDWCMFLDLDNYFRGTLDNIPDADVVRIPVRNYGANGHIKSPSLPMDEAYNANPISYDLHFKYIFKKTQEEYKEYGLWIEGDFPTLDAHVDHYVTMSWEDFILHAMRGSQKDKILDTSKFFEYNPDLKGICKLTPTDKEFKYKFAICSMIKDENDYLEEWIQHHKDFEIFLFEDYDSKSHKDICDKYDYVHLSRIEDIEDELKPLPPSYTGCKEQVTLYNWFCDNHDDIKWCMFTDIDEFIDSDGYTLEDFDRDYSDCYAVMLSWRTFGSGGKLFKGRGKVTERFTKESPNVDKGRWWGVKSIIQIGVHKPIWISNHTIDREVGWDKECGFNTDGFGRIWLNHYITKSWQEFCEKYTKRGDVNKSSPRPLHLYFAFNPEQEHNASSMIRDAVANKWLPESALKTAKKFDNKLRTDNQGYRNVDVMIGTDTLRMYCVYHEDHRRLRLLREKKLSLFKTTGVLAKENLNDIQRYVCEYAAMFYAWKHYKKTDYIGFCHYGRKFESLNVKHDVVYCKRMISGSLRYFFNRMGCQFLFDDLMDYTKTFDKDSYEYSFYLKRDYHRKFVANECFICRYEIFDRMMHYIQGYLDYIDKKYNLQRNPFRYKKFIEEFWVNNGEMDHNGIYQFFGHVKDPHLFNNQYRIIAYLIEVLLGMYITYFPNIKIVNYDDL